MSAFFDFIVEETDTLRPIFLDEAGTRTRRVLLGVGLMAGLPEQ